MKNNIFFRIVCIFSISLIFSSSASLFAQKAYDLRCEYLFAPIGVDAPNPRLTWKTTEAPDNYKQHSYRIIVSTDSADFTNSKTQVWNTGWVNNDNQLVHYNGKPLKPFTRYYWQLALNSTKTEPGSIAGSFFETGMMSMKNWVGHWISDGLSVHERPAPYFRHVFAASKKIVKATAYIAAAGLYELSINGKRIGDHILDPMYTRFDRRNLYVSYDVTHAINTGKNAIGVLLGNGWYNHQSTAVWNFHNAPWRNRPAFCLDLRITYTDGSVETISSGKNWKTTLSPVIFNSIYTAEHYDARKELPGWNTVNYNDSSWRTVGYRAAPSDLIVSQTMHPVRHTQAIPVKTVRKFNDTTWVFDLGRNISGVSKIKATGPSGTIIRLKHAERLYDNGRVDMSNIDVHYRPTDKSDPFQTDIFILSGKGEEEFMPLFNYKGFQYIEVTSSVPLELDKNSLTGYFMHSDVPALGKIETSNPTMNKIWWATNNSYLSNLFGFPTDCPQREKNGWTGDAHIAIETGLYNFDGITIYEKWLADHRDEQQPNGVLPAIIPTGGWGYEWANGPDWTSSIAIIPWNIYLFYGDTTLLSQCYDNIKNYVDHITATYPSGLTTWGLGDWVPVKSKSPVELTSSIYYFVDATILSKTAALLNKPDEKEKYEKLASRIRDAVNTKYLNRQTGMYGSGLQTELSAPLYWGLVPEELRPTVAANLAARVKADSNHIDVGLLGTKTILNALSENGYADVAYSVASQETYPSWGWWIVNGATTLYENWPIDAGKDISQNHIMFGEIGAWMYKGLGGIFPDEKNPGFKHFFLRPNFVQDLASFNSEFTSPYGKIKSSWNKNMKEIRYSVTVPPNSTATFKIPEMKFRRFTMNGKTQNLNGNREVLLTSGNYEFRWY